MASKLSVIVKRLTVVLLEKLMVRHTVTGLNCIGAVVIRTLLFW
jgi:hypothetical protein